MSTMTNSRFLDRSAHAHLQLDPTGSWGAAMHVWHAQELDALALAQASGRPLLVRGEPGTGKSQVARAAAALLGFEFRYEVITARHEAQDLLWRYDAVERLAMANKGEPTHMRDFVTPGLLWWALSPVRAFDQAMRARRRAGDDAPASTQAPARPPGTVVLIDEIDKADSELPNSLLEVLANSGFTLPWGEPLRPADEGDLAPSPTLVVITSNEERELPPAFVRRCVCLNLAPPQDADGDAFIEWLRIRAHAHFPGLQSDVLNDAAAMVLQDRRACPLGVGARPGLAEYLDLLRALQNIAPDDEALQRNWLNRLAPYALLKQFPQDQSRGLAHPDPRDRAAP